MKPKMVQSIKYKPIKKINHRRIEEISGNQDIPSMADIINKLINRSKRKGARSKYPQEAVLVTL